MKARFSVSHLFTLGFLLTTLFTFASLLRDSGAGLYA